MKVLISPLNWGLGHATRCVPVIQKFIDEGQQVTIAADGKGSQFLSQYFPQLQVVKSGSFELRYSAGKTQFWVILLQIPKIIFGIIHEHIWLQKFLKSNPHDLIISDNRFGFWTKKAECVYITHQLMVKMPRGLSILETFFWKLHKFVISKYSSCWIPDIEENAGFSGDLTHKFPLPAHAKFIGILSRFTNQTNFRLCDVDIVAIFSGLEPQRTIFEHAIIEKYKDSNQKLVIIRGLTEIEGTLTEHNHIQFFSHASDYDFLSYCKSAKKIIARSGYSTIMDLVAMDCLHKAEFFPTPGQTEQKYLFDYLKNKK